MGQIDRATLAKLHHAKERFLKLLQQHIASQLPTSIDTLWLSVLDNLAKKGILESPQNDLEFEKWFVFSSFGVIVQRAANQSISLAALVSIMAKELYDDSDRNDKRKIESTAQATLVEKLEGLAPGKRADVLLRYFQNARGYPLA